MWKFLLLVLFTSSNAFAVGQAYLDGQAAGQSVLGRSAGSVTSSNVTNIGATASNPTAVSNLQNTFNASNTGNVGLGSYGNAKVSDCASYVPDPATPEKNQECAAVNDLAKNPVAHAKAVTGLDKNDPMFTNPDNMYNKGLSGTAPSTSIGSGTSQSAVTGAGACVESTSTTPATYTDQTCTRSVVPNSKTCTITMACTVTQPASVPATPNYSCTGTDVLVGTQCQPAAFAATVNYSCSAGSVLPGNLCQPAPSAATLSYSCVSGTPSGSGASMTCVQPAISATVTYSCPSGSSLSGTNTCVPAVVNATVTYSCAAGMGTLTPGNTCQLAAYQPPVVAATTCAPVMATNFNTATVVAICAAPASNCPAGEILASSMEGGSFGPAPLFVISSASFVDGCVVGPALYSSPGVLLPGLQAIVVDVGLTLALPASAALSCPSGYTLSGSTCSPPMVTPPATAATASYSCPTNYNYDASTGTCIAPTTSATPNYACPLNYSLDASGTSCVTPSTAATDSYSCPVATDTLSVSSCYPPPVGATVSYTCPSPATVATVMTCQPPNTTAAVTYSCGAGMTPSGSSCTALPSLTETFADTCAQYQTATANPTAMPASAVNGVYVCPTGKTLSGSNCI